MSLGAVAWGQAPVVKPIRDWTFTLRKPGGPTQGTFRGETALPVADRVFEVEGIEVNTFRKDGEPDLRAKAPACRVQLTNDAFLATSSGRLQVEQVDGRFELSGEGFRWDHGAQHLVISNRVRTTVLVRLPGARVEAK
jgi:hypothetical protein